MTIAISSFDGNDTACTLSISPGVLSILQTIVILVVEKCCTNEYIDRLISILLIGDQRHKPPNRPPSNTEWSVPPVCCFGFVCPVFKTKISATYPCFG